MDSFHNFFLGIVLSSLMGSPKSLLGSSGDIFMQILNLLTAKVALGFDLKLEGVVFFELMTSARKQPSKELKRDFR